MKVAFFCAGGELGLRPLEAVAEDHEIAAVVRPAPSGSVLKRGLRQTAESLGIRRDPIQHWTSRRKVPSLEARSGDDQAVLRALSALEPDLICISTFPRLLGPALLEMPRYGALNVHPSLLPRHRGPNPYFWIYYHGDSETGVTVHQASARADAGSILLQESFTLPRGQNVARLHTQCAQLGAALLREALGSLERALEGATPQAESLTTPAPRVKPGTAMVPYERWNVEQVWHFLAGLYPHHREPILLDGRPISYSAVLGYEADESATGSGTLEPAPYGWDLRCRGGHVKLASRRFARRAREARPHVEH